MYGVIIGIDIERYSQTERTDEMQSKRNILSKIINDATNAFEIFKKKEIIDAGDGGFILIDTGNYEDVLKAVYKIREEANRNKKIRFRMVIHIGKVLKDQKLFTETTNTDGFLGDGINVAARYLDAACLKELLKNNLECNCVIAISNDFYKQVFDQSFYIEAEYTKYGFKVKDYNNLIFLNTQGIKNIPIIEKIINNEDYAITDAFKTFLDASEFVYKVKGTTSNLTSFYVYPDLIIEEPESKSSIKKISSEGIIKSFIKVPSNIIIAGDDQTGKTSLCKVFYKMVYDSNFYIPVYIRFTPKEKGNFSGKVEKALQIQYGEKYTSDFDTKIKIYILDDFYLLDDIDQRNYIDYLKKEKNTFTIIMVDSLFNSSIEKQRIVDSYKLYSITDFGYLLRTKIVEKWLNFNKINDDNYYTADELAEYLETTFIKGIIPFRPFYMLTVLAAKSDFVPLNGELTSKGHCYQALIYISLRKMNVPDEELGSFLNILSNISFYFYKAEISSFTEDEFINFLNRYSEEYNLPFEIKYFIKKISNSNVFYRNSINQYEFYAPYFYHYFVAKYLSDKITDHNIFNYVEKIYNNLHIKMNAYIGIFLVHHSKDIRLLEEVLLNTMILYDEFDEINLTKEEVKHIDDYANRLNTVVIEKYDRSHEIRENQLKEDDENISMRDTETEDEKLSETLKTELEKLKKAISTIEVMGHILKNHSGEIEKKHLKECYLNALNAYRRICCMFISEFKEHEDDFTEVIVKRIEDIKSGTLTRKELSEYIHQFFSFFNLSVIYTTIKKTADSAGSKTMMKIIKEVSDELNNPFAYCVYLQSQMWYNKSFPIEDAKKKYKEFPISIQYIIQRLLKEFTDMHHIEYRVKQQIAEAFQMKLASLQYDYQK